MIKRTSLNLDLDLVKEAKEVLGTSETTETVNKALSEIVRQQRVRSFLFRETPDLTPEALEEMRRPRFGS